MTTLAHSPSQARPQQSSAAAGRSLIGRVLAEHRLFLSLIAVYFLGAVVVDILGLAPGISRRVSYTTAYYLSPALVWVPLIVSLVRARWVVRDEAGRRVNGWRGWVLGWQLARATTLRGERVGGLILVACVVPVLMNTFAAWKSAIPVLHPFAWDAELARLDRWLHFGVDPWRLVHPLLAKPVLTVEIDRLYILWLFFVPVIVVWQAWNPDPIRRGQFLLTFVLTWILLGTALATFFSSAGPCYYALVTGEPSPYTPLLDYLKGVHRDATLLSRVGQDLLWQNHLAAGGNPYTRISAMPSLHVAMPVLYTLTAWPTARVLALLFGTYTLVILVGSVHLGWHYAVDGYVALLVVPAIWWLSGKLIRRTNHIERRERRSSGGGEG